MSNEDNKKPINPKRENLIQLSLQAFEMRESLMLSAKNEKEFEFWENCTINYMLLHHVYKNKGATKFNSFNQWKEEKATIIKGETAFVIWGQPIKGIKKGEQNGSTPNQLPDLKQQLSEKYMYWPMCYLFSNMQVILPQERKTERAEVEPPAEEQQPITLDYI